MTPIGIKIELLRTGQTAVSIAADLGVSRAYVSNVIAHKRKNPLVRRGIADALMLPYRQVWGEDDPGIDELPRGRRTAGESDSETSVTDTMDRDGRDLESA